MGNPSCPIQGRLAQHLGRALAGLKAASSAIPSHMGAPGWALLP